MEDIERAVDTIVPLNPQLSVLQCTAAYPASVEDLNLSVITTLRERFPDVVVGLSDHQNGIAMSMVAYMLGARVIEKHFTLDHAWKGTDHAFSLMPDGLRRLVRDLHRGDFPAILQNNLNWARRGVEGPNIANVFKRTFYQMLIKFQLHPEMQRREPY